MAPQPGPAMCVRLNPRNWVELKLYPPPRGRLGLVSGLHCAMPNGMSAPGKSLPPPVVMTRMSTTEAGSATTAGATAAPAMPPAMPTEATTVATTTNPTLYRMAHHPGLDNVVIRTVGFVLVIVNGRVGQLLPVA